MEWSKSWKASKSPTKQRLYKLGAPKHIEHKLVQVHLSKDLKKKYEMRNISLRIGDKVKIMRGQFKGKTGSITKVDRTTLKANVEGIEQVRKDGTKNPYSISTSNLLITELNLDDKKRKQKVERNLKK